MTIQEHQLSLEEFITFVHRDNNINNIFEFIDGEIVEVSPSQTNYSEVSQIITFEVRLFCHNNNVACHTSGEVGAYNILNNVIAPDFAYKTTPMHDTYPDPVPPEWAVEVISPNESTSDIAQKRQIYLDAGILYWEVYLKAQRVDVYAPGQYVQSFGIGDILDGSDILPGFRLAVNQLV